jgi:ubiquinone biosynthesis protein
VALPNPYASIQRLETQAKRMNEVVRVLARYRMAGWLREIPLPWVHQCIDCSPEGPIEDMSRDERIRHVISDLGTTSIKLGQMLSTRPDLVGPELATELSKLQSNTPPNPPKVVRTVFIEEFGKGPEEMFAEFDERAFASASVAQVHRALLPTGERVVVKVQKQGIQKKVEEDLSIMSSLAELAEKHFEDVRPYQPVQLVDEFRRSLMNELDFTRERRNLDTFIRNFKDDPSVRFPGAYPEFSSRRVLTMDMMDGILGTDIEALRDSGSDLKEFARRGTAVFLDMIFRDSFYHADPHPGNLMLMPDDVVGIIDCGMVGRLDENLHDDFESLMLSISQLDAEILTDALWKLSTEKPTLGRSELQADLSELLAETAQVSIDEIDMGELLRRLTAIIRKYRISLRPALTQLLRTMVLLEGTAQRLDPKFSLTEVIEPYTQQLIVDRFTPSRIGRRLMRSYRDWDRLIQTFPRDAGEALTQIQSGRFQIQVEHRNLDRVVNRLVLGIVLAALLLGSSLMWSMKAPPLALGVSVFGAAGFLAALAVSFTLLRSMLKSSKNASQK